MRFGIRSSAFIAMILLALAAFIGCGEDADDDGGLSVIASIYPLGYFTERIGGDQVTVKVLVEPGVEAHGFEPTASDLRAIGAANLVVMNGLELEPWLERALEALEDSATRVVVEAADQSLAIEGLPHDDHGHGEHEEGEHHEGEGEEHEEGEHHEEEGEEHEEGEHHEEEGEEHEEGEHHEGEGEEHEEGEHHEGKAKSTRKASITTRRKAKSTSTKMTVTWTKATTMARNLIRTCGSTPCSPSFRWSESAMP